MEVVSLKPGKKVYFYSEKGLHFGTVEKINKNTINVIVEDKDKKEGYQLWRVEEFFLQDTQQEALEKWGDYKFRLKEFYRVLNERRKLYEFYRDLHIIVEPLNNAPYSGTVLRVCKATVEMSADDGRYMKVDKSLCTPSHLYGGQK